MKKPAFKFSSKTKGFTLVELLVVIAVLAILAALLVILANPLKNLSLARDGVRKNDLSLLKNSLATYFTANGKYPDSLTVLGQEEKFTVPKDPKDPLYTYVYSVDNSKNPPEYTICAYLEIEQKASCFLSTQNNFSLLDASSSAVPSGLIGSGGTQGQSYAVVPVIFFASDTVVPDEAAYRNQVNASFNDVKIWFAGQFDGKTFDLLPAIFYRSTQTDAQLHAEYGNGGGIWFQGTRETVEANGMDVCDPTKLYYFVTPINNMWGGAYWQSWAYGCNHAKPGLASIPDHMGRLIGGVTDPGWPEWWADEIREAQGGVAHELGHDFGGTCVTETNCTHMEHSVSPSIMYSWWDYGLTGTFLPDEKTKILTSPFIH